MANYCDNPIGIVPSGSWKSHAFGRSCEYLPSRYRHRAIPANMPPSFTRLRHSGARHGVHWILMPDVRRQMGVGLGDALMLRSA